LISSLVLTGLDAEARALARALALPRLGALGFAAFGRGPVRVAAVGIGARALDDRWAALTAGLPVGLAVSAGVCGGLDPRLRPGDLVLPARVLAPDGEVLAVSGAVREALVARLTAVAPAATLVTSDEVLGTPEAKAALRARTGAAVVDMESARIMRCAAAAGVPALVVRAVSDGAGETVPDQLLALVEPGGRVRAARAVRAIATSSGLLRDALRLRRTTRRALHAVAWAVGALGDAA
jgi:adenosylhomocysteine nucleosidase